MACWGCPKLGVASRRLLLGYVASPGTPCGWKREDVENVKEEICRHDGEWRVRVELTCGNGRLQLVLP